MKWYIAKCPTGAEHNSMKIFKELLVKLHLEDDFADYFVPYENSSARRSKRSNMANYIFIKMNLTQKMKELLNRVESMNLMLDENLDAIEQSDEVVEKMLSTIKKSNEHSANYFQIGENVKILDAPFEDFSAVIEKVDISKEIVTVTVPILGRQISLELSFKSIKRIKD